MKNINSLIVVVIVLWSIQCNAQTEVRDTKVATQKGIIVGLLAAEMGLKGIQGSLIKQLKHKEYLYNAKKSILANLSNGTVFMVTRDILNEIKNDIAAIKYNIRLGKRFKLRHGLSGYEEAINKEEKYYQRLVKDYKVQNKSAFFVGGVGYNYTAYLKILKRATKLKKQTLEIDKQVKSLMGVSRLLSK